MSDDTTKLLIEIRDLLRTTTEIAMRNEQRFNATTKLQRRAIAAIAVLGLALLLTVASIGLLVIKAAQS